MAVASELCGHADANGAAATSRSALGLKILSDAFADGRRFRILAIVDDFTGAGPPANDSLHNRTELTGVASGAGPRKCIPLTD
jgi:hypothetical protein